MEKIKIGQKDSSDDFRKIRYSEDRFADLISRLDDFMLESKTEVVQDLLSDAKQSKKHFEKLIQNELCKTKIPAFRQNIEELLNSFREDFSYFIEEMKTAKSIAPGYLPVEVIEVQNGKIVYNDNARIMVEEKHSIYLETEVQHEIYNLSCDIVAKIKELDSALQPYGISTLGKREIIFYSQDEGSYGVDIEMFDYIKPDGLFVGR